MSANIQVKCSGALYASLHCELITHDKVQEGFLLGEIEKFTSHSISDSEIDNENANININISGYIPCSTVGSFYSGCGRIKFQHLKHIAGHNLKKIVGWYRSRSFTDSLFLKETRIHEQLRKEMVDISDYFLFALFSRMKPASTGTMDINYKFQIMLNNNEFEGVSLSVVNMKDTSTSQYIKTASSVFYDSDSLQNILGTIQNIEPGVQEIETLHNGLLNQIRSLLPKYASVHEQYHEVLQRVSKLREFCHNSGLKIDFQVNESPDDDFDLLDFQCSPSKPSKQQANSLNLAKTKISDGKSDPFDFVKKEMGKEQGSAKKQDPKTRKETGSQSEKCEANESNDVKNKRISKTIKKNLLGAESPSRVKTSDDVNGRGDKVGNSSDRKTIKDSKENLVPRSPKVIRGSQFDAIDKDNDGLNRQHSPARETNNTPKKTKEREALADNKMCSGSPEF